MVNIVQVLFTACPLINHNSSKATPLCFTLDKKPAKYGTKPITMNTSV